MSHYLSRYVFVYLWSLYVVCASIKESCIEVGCIERVVLVSCIERVVFRVRSDKYRTVILKKTGNFPTKHFVHYKLKKVNFLYFCKLLLNYYHWTETLILSAMLLLLLLCYFSRMNAGECCCCVVSVWWMLDNYNREYQTFFKLIWYTIFSFKFDSFIENC